MLKRQHSTMSKMQLRGHISDTQLLTKHEKIPQDKQFMAVLRVVKHILVTLISWNFSTPLFWCVSRSKNINNWLQTVHSHAVKGTEETPGLSEGQFQKVCATWRKGVAALREPPLSHVPPGSPSLPAVSEAHTPQSSCSPWATSWSPDWATEALRGPPERPAGMCGSGQPQEALGNKSIYSHRYPDSTPTRSKDRKEGSSMRGPITHQAGETLPWPRGVSVHRSCPCDLPGESQQQMPPTLQQSPTAELIRVAREFEHWPPGPLGLYICAGAAESRFSLRLPGNQDRWAEQHIARNSLRCLPKLARSNPSLTRNWHLNRFFPVARDCHRNVFFWLEVEEIPP